MRRLIGLAIMAAIPATVSAAPGQGRVQPAGSVSADARLVQAVDRFAAETLAAKTAAGLAVGILRDGRVQMVRGYGFSDLENEVPVDERTVFRIGSVTKQFTAASILLLAERGKLSVDDPLSKYLPEFDRSRKVTLRQLLNHTSGIRNYTADGFFKRAAREDRTTDELVRFIGGLDPLYQFEPGAAWSYSNSGYILLGAVIEKVSGQPFDQFLRSNILDPLGLRDTAMDDLDEILAHRARGYEASKDAGGFVNTGFLSMSAAGAAGAMRSTPGDLLKWQSALFGGRLLKPASLAMMVEPARLGDGRPTSLGRVGEKEGKPQPEYGLGLAIDRQSGRRLIGHGGSINGFNAWTQTFPDQRLSLVLLTNTGGAAYAVAPKLTEAVFEALER